MKEFLRSFKMRVLLSFLVLKVVLISWLFFYYNLTKKSNDLLALRSDLKQIELSLVSADAEFQRFILHGSRDSSFLANSAQARKKFSENQQNLQLSLTQLQEKFKKYSILQDNVLENIKKQSVLLGDSVDTMFELLSERGFVDFGKEGKMRYYAHQLEDLSQLSKEDVLVLRRHEKDFIMRSNPMYVSLFNAQIQQIQKNKFLNEDTRTLLRKYASEFNEYVSLEAKLGIRSNTNLYLSVSHLFTDLKRNLWEVVSASTTQINRIEQRFEHNLLIVSIVALVIAVLLSFYLTYYLTRDLNALNTQIVKRKTGDSKQIKRVLSNISEISQLQQNFDDLWDAYHENLVQLQKDKKIAEQATEAKAQFLANMSHEIRTPLNGVIGMLYALRSTHLNQEQLSHVEVIEHSANHLMNLVNMVLDHSKIDAGHMQIEEIEFNLLDDLHKLSAMFQAILLEKQIKLSFNIDEDVSPNVFGDPLRIQQVLINLLNNAIKFTDKGWVELSVQQVAVADKEQTLRFSIKDSGIGISKDKIAKLFGAFTQSDVSITRQYGGTGLGLTISSALVKLMGGKLHVESNLGKGSTFWFEIAFKIAEDKSLTKVEPKLALPASINQGLHVLVAEDNPINQKVICFMLQHFNMKIDTVENGLEAVNAYNQTPSFDIIFMDLQMPELDGFEATKLITNSRKYKKRPIPIIAVSANAFSEDQIKAREAGMTNFLPKPIKMEHLKGVVEKLVLHKASA